MMLVAGSIALLAIYAGAKLLIVTKKENLGIFYQIIAWFIMVAATLLVLGTLCGAVMRNCHGGGECNTGQGCDRPPMHAQHQFMMKHGRMMGGHMNMKGCAGMMDENCGMRMEGSCGSHMMGGQCGEKCQHGDKMGGACEGMKGCASHHGKMDMMTKGGACCKKDSLAKK